ncbi:MAG: pirin family protein [Acidimicrobiales bacterium]
MTTRTDTDTGARPAPGIDVRRAADRFVTRTGWLDSRHSFAFGHHRDPRNTHHGLLLVSNDDVVAPGTGFDTHPHRDMEIVTWVLQGSLVHQDSTGNHGVIYPGLAQRMSAGRGILHSEKNDAWRLGGEPHEDPVRFVQMWVVPDTDGIDPGYEQLELPAERLASGLVPVASGREDAHNDDAAIRISNRFAALHAARPTVRGSGWRCRHAVPAPVRGPEGDVQLRGAARSPRATPSASPGPVVEPVTAIGGPGPGVGRCTQAWAFGR